MRSFFCNTVCCLKFYNPFYHYQYQLRDFRYFEIEKQNRAIQDKMNCVFAEMYFEQKY
jgi:hypothetical protein